MTANAATAAPGHAPQGLRIDIESAVAQSSAWLPAHWLQIAIFEAKDIGFANPTQVNLLTEKPRHWRALPDRLSEPGQRDGIGRRIATAIPETGAGSSPCRRQFHGKVVPCIPLISSTPTARATRKSRRPRANCMLGVKYMAGGRKRYPVTTPSTRSVRRNSTLSSNVF